MDEWKVVFANASLVPWVGAIWAELPDAGLTPVSWQQARVLPGGTAEFRWDDQYLVVLGTFADTPPSGVYTPQALATRKAKPSSTWVAATLNGVDCLAEDEHGGTEGPIRISNQSRGPVNAGLALTLPALTYAADLPVGGEITFKLEPRFQFGLFADVVEGQVIKGTPVVVGPRPLQFPPGVRQLLVTAIQQGQTVTLTVVPA